MCSARVQQFLRVSGASRAVIRSRAQARVSGRARYGSTTVEIVSFSRWGQRWAATLVAAATACFFVVFTTIDDRAVAVRVCRKRLNQSR